MKFARLASAALLSVLLVGGALSNAKTGVPPATPSSRNFLVVLGNYTFGSGNGQIAIYPLAGGIPQNVNSPYQYTFTGVPGSVSVDPAALRLYITATTSGTNGNYNGGILGYKYNGENGFTLAKLQGSPFHPTGYEYGYGLAGDYTGGFMYASNFGNNNISGFQIASNGSIGQQVPGSPFPAGTYPDNVALDAQDGFLYSANYSGSTIYGYQVNSSTGTLTALPGSPYVSGSFPGNIVADPVHHLLYVGALYDMTIWVYTITSSGALVPASGSPFSTGEITGGLSLNPSGNLLYAIAPDNNNLLGYGVNTATGALTPLHGFPVPLGLDPSSSTFDPTGEFLYALNYEGQTFNAFRVGPSGGLTALPGSPFAITSQFPVTVLTVTIP
jgi:6-phosphogluconolactonase (cycloisomerase 2 family)